MTRELQKDQNSYKVVECSIMDKRGKYFQGGRYIGKSPKKAAAKAAKRLLSLAEDDKTNFGHNSKVDSVVFKIRQTTRGSEHNEYVYKAKKLKGKVEMVTIKIGNDTLQVPKSSNIEVDAAEESELVKAMDDAKRSL